MAKRRMLVTGHEATRGAKKQHMKPCGDCPWRRDALPGWLGNLTADDWLRAAHGESRIDCHTIAKMQCAGAAIYRRNVCKRMHDPKLLVLDADRERVFSNPMEFKEYHGKGPSLIIDEEED